MSCQQFRLFLFCLCLRGFPLIALILLPAFTLFCFFVDCRQRYPPRSLFDLVDPESMSRQEILNRVASVSLFKAPSSWSMAGLSSCAGSSSPLSSDGKVTWSSANFLSNRDSANVRAKLASGVPILMTTVEHSTLSSSPTWGSRRHVERAKRRRRLLKLAMYKRILSSIFRSGAGSSSSESTTTGVAPAVAVAT